MPVPAAADVALAILGGGPAGLAAGQRAAGLGVDFGVWEAASRPGGCCRTFEVDGFRFDSGAHRLHDRDQRLTAELNGLMTVPLHRVESPSCILDRGRRLDFPLSPLDLLRKLGPAVLVRATTSLAAARLRGRALPPAPDDFAGQAIRSYGRHLAERFLLGYSEKLWGVPAATLSNRIAGRRLRGLTLSALVAEAVGGARARTRHLDGAFVYPQGGIGALTDALLGGCGDGRVHLNRAVTRLSHDGARVQSLTLSDGTTRSAARFVSTLSLPQLITMLVPAPPIEVLSLAAGLRFRSLLLVNLGLNIPSVSSYATMYVPTREVPITRIHEPRNRCPTMAPPGQTSLVAELPCWPDDDRWRQSDDELSREVVGQLVQLGLISADQVLGATVIRLTDAYPLLDRQHAGQVTQLRGWLRRFGNLAVVGRNGRFAYQSLHEVIADGQAAVEKGCGRPAA